MSAKAIWGAGFLAVAGISGYVAYTELPRIEGQVRKSVNKALADSGLEKQVSAKVSGQTVVLELAEQVENPAQTLAMAEAVVREAGESPTKDIQLQGFPVQGWLAGPVAYVLTSSGQQTQDATEAPEAIAGLNATTVADASVVPTVAGVAAPVASAIAAPAQDGSCAKRVETAVAGRKLGFTVAGNVLTPESQSALNDVAQAVAKCPSEVKVVVAGYTDSTGDAEASQIVSKARAQIAADGLVERGISAKRIQVVGYGQENPVADNGTPEGRAMNRRITVQIVGE